MSRRPRTSRQLSQNLAAAAQQLSAALARVQAPLGEAAYVLDPLTYAWGNHRRYLERFAQPGVEAVLVGMNPGPWGMAQTGVPFGSVDYVTGFLGFDDTEDGVVPPERTHPKRPIQGLACPRTEVSGQRLWGGVQQCFGTPAAFFSRFFVLNYCPLLFTAESGRNVVPEKLPKDDLAAIQAACDEHLRRALELLSPQTAIGIGKWAEKRVRAVAEPAGLELEIGSILHPSPASPAANRGWLPQARAQLEALGHAWPAPPDGSA